MRVGSLRKPFALQAESLVEGDHGGSSPCWTSIATVWGMMRLASVDLPSSDLSRRVSHEVMVRYRKDISIQTGMRLLSNKRVFLIRSVMDIDEAQKWQKLLVEETVVLN